MMKRWEDFRATHPSHVVVDDDERARAGETLCRSKGGIAWEILTDVALVNGDGA